MNHTRTSRITAAGIGALFLLTSGAAAGAKAGDVRTSGRCTGASTWKLKLKTGDGALEAEAEVDQNRNGVRWTVWLDDNKVRVFTGTAVTKAPSGSFSVSRRIPNRAGTDAVVLRATNPATGEVCRGTASI